MFDLYDEMLAASTRLGTGTGPVITNFPLRFARKVGRAIVDPNITSMKRGMPTGKGSTRVPNERQTIKPGAGTSFSERAKDSTIL